MRGILALVHELHHYHPKYFFSFVRWCSGSCINSSLSRYIDQSNFGSNEPVLFLNNNNDGQNLRQNCFPIILTQVRKIMIGRMAKPLEVLITLDETGYPIKEVMDNTENNALYDVMKELMANLSRLDWENMYQILKAKLEAQVFSLLPGFMEE